MDLCFFKRNKKHDDPNQYLFLPYLWETDVCRYCSEGTIRAQVPYTCNTLKNELGDTGES